jgi:hypothetical protein
MKLSRISQPALQPNIYGDFDSAPSPSQPQTAATFDVTILLAADRRKSLWAASVGITQASTTRTAALAPRGMTQHGLLAIALTSALGSIGKKRIARIQSRNRNQTLRIHVLVGDDTDFVSGIRHLIAGEKAGPEFRIGRNLYKTLHARLRGYSITIDLVSADDVRIGILGSWAKSVVINPRKFLPSLFIPDAISQT